MRHFATRLLAVLIAFMLVPGLTLAQDTGKLTGKVVEAETGKPLPGANVRLAGTTLGAATNSEGEYTIFEVPPGTYTVVVTFVGYQTVRRTNVEIASGVTKRLDFQLQQAEFKGQEVVVRAQEELVRQTATNAVRRLGREEFEKLPTRQPETFYTIQPGVVEQNGEIHIRGARSNQTDFLLEGLSSRSLIGTNNVVSVIPEALQEVQVFAGGYAAMRGGANGGIIQQTLRTGGEELSAMAQYVGDQIAEPVNDTYSYNEHDVVATVGGPLYWDNVRFFVAGQYRETDNFNPLFWDGAQLNEVAGPGPGLCADVSQPDCHPPVDDISRAAVADTAVRPFEWGDGNLPGIGRPQEEFRINGTLTANFDPLKLRLSWVQTNRERRDNDFPITNFFNQKRIQKQESLRRLVSFQPTYFLTDNTYLKGTFGFFQFETEQWDPLMGKPDIQSNGGRLPDLLDYADRFAVARQLGVDTTQQALNGNIYTRDWQGRYQPPPAYQFNAFTFARPGALGSGYSIQEQSYWKTRLGLISQRGNHTIQIGGEYKKWTVRRWGMGAFTVRSALASNVRSVPTYVDSIRQETEGVAFDLRQAGLNYYGYGPFGHEVDSGPNGPKEPVTAAAWINDKIEYEDIIVNVGLRFNYYDMDLWTPKNRKDPPYVPGTAQVLVGGEEGLREASADTNILPRVGLAFPIGDQTAFHLQYGKFAQMPDMANAYEGRAAMGEVFRGRFFISSPFAWDLDPVETTQYEIGFGHQFAEFAAFDLTAYYRQTDGQVSITQIQTESGSAAANYNLFVNKGGLGDFSITRGIELSVRTRRVGGFMTMINYSLNDAKGTNSEPSGQVAAIEANLPTPSQIQPLAFMQKHQGSAILDYRSGSDQPLWAQNWTVNLLYRFSSGHRYTSSTGGLGQRGAQEGSLLPDQDPRNRVPLEPLNSSTTPFTSTIDLRVEKGFDLGPAQATAFIYVQNLLNEKNVRNVYLRSGNAQQDGFFTNPRLSEEIIAQQGPDFVEYYQEINLDNRRHYRQDWGRDLFGDPRQVRFGFRITY